MTHYTYDMHVYICDDCKIRIETAESRSLPEGWRRGEFFEGLRKTNYNKYIVNLHKHFCKACAEKLEIEETFS